MRINSRRYIGCKTKLLENIYDTALECGLKKGDIIADIFAGTGVVANRFAEAGYKTIVNDTLYSNVVAYKALLGPGEIRKEVIASSIERYNAIDGNNLVDNYFSKIYGNKYFSTNDARKIGYIRDCIEEEKDKYTQREYCYLIASLMYACDRIANTVGHFESFLLRDHIDDKGVIMNEFEINPIIIPADIYNEDANILVKHIESDVAYIDPPYNARQYVNFYHVLENLARWNKPTEFEGNSMKFKRNELKSDYCRSKAPVLFTDLILSLKTKTIIVSYNNTYKAGSISSVNTISEEHILETLGKRGKVTRKSIDYKAFNAGKTELSGHKEYLFVCEVNQ